MLVVTGGSGFIGSVMVWSLNNASNHDIAVVDHLGTGNKWENLAKRRINTILHKDDFSAWLANNKKNITGIIHMGACSTTTEADADYLVRNNFAYSCGLFEFCTENDVPFVYASSAATYGAGEHGFSDADDTSVKLRPINKYGFSKQLFDSWVLQQRKRPKNWWGLKFFNVYGPQEYHKGAQASVIYHAVPQVRDNKELKLFKSYRDGIGHGEQRRDFVYVKDVCNVMKHLLNEKSHAESGIYNLGSGKARTFKDLGEAVFKTCGVPAKFNWIEMPDNLREQYQYFTEADLTKLRKAAGYTTPFTSLEDGVRDYLQNYLLKADRYL